MTKELLLTEMPEEIWVSILGQQWRTEAFRGHVHYIRADLPTPAPEVEEAIEPLSYQIRFVEQHGTLHLDGAVTGQYWQVNGKRFDHYPSPEEVNKAYIITAQQHRCNVEVLEGVRDVMEDMCSKLSARHGLIEGYNDALAALDKMIEEMK